jgi:PKD repeat protein
VPLTVHFSASGSYDPDGGDIRMVSWDFGDGTGASTLNEPLHEFVEPGTYVVVLTVTDDEGTTSRAQIEIDARHSNGRGRIRRNGP